MSSTDIIIFPESKEQLADYIKVTGRLMQLAQLSFDNFDFRSHLDDSFAADVVKEPGPRPEINLVAVHNANALTLHNIAIHSWDREEKLYKAFAVAYNKFKIA